MMTHGDHPAGHVLQAYHDGELDSERAAATRAHCESCSDCRDELAQLAALGRLLADSPAPEPRHALWPGLQARRVRESRPRTRFALAACAAGVLLGVLLGPLQFSAQESAGEVAWTETLWSEETSSSLLGVYQSGQD